jgi:4-amino-4-deoxy-L-arabinose transferase-like glycosyltransferase
MTEMRTRTKVEAQDATVLDRWRSWQVLGVLLGISLLVRLFLVFYPEVIYNDGAEYVRHARQIFTTGDWAGGKAAPLYPFLMALAYPLVHNFEMAGIWVSVIFGILIILPVFYLGKALFNERVGILASLFTIVQPLMFSYSGSVLTESLYYFLLASAVLFGWDVFRRARLRDYFLFSVVTALAYLTRPEAIGFLFVTLFWVLFLNPPGTRRPVLRRVFLAGSLLFLFLVFSSPYLLKIREDTGHWGVTKKFSVSVGSLVEEDNSSLETFTKTKKISLSSFLKEPFLAVKKIAVGSVRGLYQFAVGFHPLLFALALFGFIFEMTGRLRDGPSRKGSLYLLSYFIFYVALLFPFLWVARRYISQLIPVALPWAAVGTIALVEWAAPRWREGRMKRQVGVIMLSIVVVVLFIRGRATHSRENRHIQKEVGLWMKDHLPQGGKIMSKLPQEAFYAERPWVMMPALSYEEILMQARSRGVRYIVIDEEIVKDSPDFLEKSKRGELRLLLEREKKKRKMAVFERTDFQGN